MIIDHYRSGIGGIIPPPPPYATEVAADGPLGWWRLGESSGNSTAVDIAGGRNGTYSVSGCTLGTTGLIARDSNTAVLFDGVAGRCLVTDRTAYALGKADFSIELWMSYTTTAFATVCAIRAQVGTSSTIQGVIAVGRQSAGDIAAETWAWNTENTRARTSTAKNDGQKHHVVATYTASDDTLRLYVDGALEDSRVQGSANPTGTAYGVCIGSNISGIQWFPGVVDEVAYYSKVLSPERIAAHYAAGA